MTNPTENTTAAPTTGPAEEVTAEEAAETAETATQADAGGPDDDGKPKGARAKIDALTEERDGLAAQLDAERAQTFDRAVESLGLAPALMRAAGLSVADHLGEDGTVDVDGLLAAADAKRSELGLSRRPRPNPVAGANRGDARGASERPSWADVFGAHSGKPQ